MRHSGSAKRLKQINEAPRYPNVIPSSANYPSSRNEYNQKQRDFKIRNSVSRPSTFQSKMADITKELELLDEIQIPGNQ